MVDERIQITIMVGLDRFIGNGLECSFGTVLLELGLDTLDHCDRFFLGSKFGGRGGQDPY